MKQPSGTVTLLFTDIEGSTRLLDELGAAEYREVLAAHRRVLREAFDRHDGYEVDYEGDAFFVAFADAAAAARAAGEAQAALQDGPVGVRMGLHTGTPLVDPPKYVGLDVHLAARIMSAAHGGQVLLSSATRARVHEDVRDLGEHRLKDFAEPVSLFQLGEGSFPPLKTISNTNLPRPASSFVGREREVTEVVSLLRKGARLVTLTGPGGSGKTRLAIEAASELVGEFRNGVFWVGMATIRDPELVLPTTGQMLGARGELAAHIGEKELLLLLDNLEQVVEAASELAALVEACPNLGLIVTSRELLRVRGEVEYDVRPLADRDAVELFCGRSGLAGSPALEELCRRLDNMPLALELAAARTKALSPEQILDRLGERLDLLKGGRDADPRQRTLRATIEWSYDLLDAAEQRLFARLAVFAGGCTLAAAEQVAGADLDTLQSLVEKNLVRHAAERFWMLETIREFAVERLEERVEADELRRRHAEFLVSLGEASGLAYESEAEERYDLIRPEEANFRAALAWALDADPGLGVRLAVSIEYYWYSNSPFEGRRWLEALLDRGDGPLPELRAAALRCLAGAVFIVGDYDEGRTLHEESLALYRRLGDERGASMVLPRLAIEAGRTGDLELARALCAESLEIHRRLGFRKAEARVLATLGFVESQLGRWEEALELVDRSARLAAEIGSRWWEAGSLLNGAQYALELGRVEEARSRACASLSIARAIGDRRGTVWALATLAAVEVGAGRAERANRIWGAIEAEELRGPIGQWEGEGEHDELAARVLAAAGPDFERERAEGRALALDEAVDEALSVDSPS
jgi:predicted ATPase